MRNNDPFAPWNDPMYKDDPMAPHNDPMRSDDFTEPWNDLWGSERDLKSDRDRRAYGLRPTRRYDEEDW